MIFISRKLNLNIFFYIHLKVSQACANLAWFRLENAWQSAILDVTAYSIKGIRSACIWSIRSVGGGASSTKAGLVLSLMT